MLCRMARAKYTAVMVPIQLTKEVDDIVKRNERGYTSRAEFVKDAVRRLAEEIKRERPQEKNGDITVQR